MLFKYRMFSYHLKLLLLVLAYPSCQHATITRFSLKEAVKEGNFKKFKICLKQGQDAKAIDSDGSTLLHWACASYESATNKPEAEQKIIEEERKEIMKELLKRDISMLNKSNEGGSTPLHCAAKRGFESGVDFLLKEQASPNSKDNKGFSPLDYALKEPVVNKHIVDKLIKAGGKP